LDEQARGVKQRQLLERNRITAGKCRQRKKMNTENLEEGYNILQKRNVALRELVSELEVETQKLRDLLKSGSAGDIEAGYNDREKDVEEKPSQVL